MSESKSVLTEKCDQRPVMHKRVEQMEDGRILIYYTFEESTKKDVSSLSGKADNQEGAK